MVATSDLHENKPECSGDRRLITMDHGDCFFCMGCGELGYTKGDQTVRWCF